MKRIFSQLLAAAILATSITQVVAQPVTASIRRDASTLATAKPKLVVVIVMDQVRAEYLTRYAKYFGKDGFNRLIKGGANFTNANYSHATTYTGPGHAQILSGSFGHTNGIIGNRWYNPKSKLVETMFYDADAKIPGVELDPKEDDTSPRNFIGNNLCDQLLLSNHFHSKAIAVSIKDRAAIMLAGKLGKAYWMHNATGGMVTSTYYFAEMPAWMKAFNAKKIPESYFGKAWTKSLPEAEYSLSRQDDFPQETNFHGLGKTFPHILTDPSGKPAVDFYDAFTATPFGTDYTLQAAREAVENEGLGNDEYPDILGVSITPPDIAGHAFGPDSQEMQDTMARMDGQLAGFFKYLDGRFQSGEVLIALTSDHGATPIPEYMSSLGIEAGRIKKKQLSDAINSALTEKYGAPDGGANWIIVLEDPSVFLNQAIIIAKKLNPAEVQRVVGEAAVSVKGIAAYYTRTQLQSGTLPDNHWAKMYEKSFYAERSGDVLLQPKPFYFWGSYGEKDSGSTHGSPYEYDTHVPLLLWGAGIKPGQYSQNVDMSDLAPTLANILGINPPAGSEGRCLSEVLLP